MTNQLNEIIENGSAIVLVPILNVVAWSISILKKLRAYPGTVRSTEEWDDTYKIRTAVE